MDANANQGSLRAHRTELRSFFPSTGMQGNLPSELAPLFPSLEEAGFDAIFQLRSDYLQKQLQESLENTDLATLRTTTPFDPDMLPRPIRVFSGRPVSFEVVIYRPRLITMLADPPPTSEPVLASEFGSGSSFYANIEWAVDLNLIIEVFQGEVEAAQLPQSQPQPSSQPAVAIGPGVLTTGSLFEPPPLPQEKVLLARGTALTSARLELSVRPAQFKTWVQLDFHPKVLELNEAMGPFQTLLERGLAGLVDETFDPLFNGLEVNLTPQMSLSGALRAGESLPELGGFRAVFSIQELRPDMVPATDTVVVATTATGERGGTTSAVPPLPGELAPTDLVVAPDFGSPSTVSEALSIGVNVKEHSPTGDLNRVFPFFEDNNFAYYVSEEILQAVILLRWKRLKLPEGFVVQSPVELTDSESDEIFTGSARVRFTLLDTIPEVSLVVTEVDTPDAFQLIGEQEVQLLRLWQDGKEITDDIRDDDELKSLLDPTRTPLLWRIHPFEPRPIPETTASLFFKTVARHLLEPVYRPTIEPLQIRNISGVTSSPAHVVIVRGNLG